MKIAFYVPSWPAGTRPNGIVTYAGHLVPALRRLGHEVFVLTPDKTGDGDPDLICLSSDRKLSIGYRVLFKLAPNFAHHRMTSALIVAAIKRLVTDHDIDVVEIEESFGWSYDIAKLKLVPVLVRLHGPNFKTAEFSATWNARRRQFTEGRGIAHADFVTSPSQALLGDVRAHYRIKLENSRAFPNPVAKVTRQDRWELSQCDRQSLLFVGRFDTLKGGDLVIAAFVELAKANPQLNLTFVGPDRGVGHADDKLVGFEEFCASLPVDVRARIVFTGALPQAEIAKLRTKHFLTICASRSETLGYILLEAMASGCPVVSSAVGGIPEVVRSGENGLLFPPNDVPAMVVAIQTLLDAPDLAARYGEQAWHDCNASLSADQIAQMTIQCYQDAITAFNARAGK
jgi:glycosyltransferase involved in cell wall biosynthesis